MSGQRNALLIWREILVGEHASPFLHSVPGWDAASFMWIMTKSVVNEGDWEET
ncbi:MAG: hypothetical protein QW292_08040 [Candidatus Parvarchaeota archaeon]